jgi:hypothetical protein
MSLNPIIWGPHAWIFLHSVTLSYSNCPTNNEKQNMKKFMNSVGKILPCEKCRNNFKKHILKHELNNNVLNSKKSLVKWMLNMHNEVNHSTGKEKITYEQLLDIYDKMYSNVPKNNPDLNLNIVPAPPKYSTTLILVVLLIIIIIITICVQIIKQLKIKKKTTLI